MKTKNLIQTIREKNKFIDHLIEEGLNDVRKIVDLEADQELMLGINVKLKAEVERLKKENLHLQVKYDAQKGHAENCLDRWSGVCVKITEYNEFLYNIRIEPWYKMFSLKKRISEFFELNNKVNLKA